MRYQYGIVLASCWLVACLAGTAMAQEIRVYEGDDYSGDDETFDSGESALSSRWNDRISSVRVEGRWELCKEADFRDCVTVRDDIRDLRTIRLNDEISSLRPIDDDDYDNDYDDEGELIVYEDDDFDGRKKTFDSSESSLDGSWNDRISSVRVEGEWELCKEANFRDCRTVDDDEDDLSRLGLDDSISSVRLVGNGRDNDDDDDYDDHEITVYEDDDYDGRKTTYDRAMSALDGSWNDRISSVRVEGEWELCREANFRDCRTVDDDEDDLSRLGLDDSISSLRPVRD